MLMVFLAFLFIFCVYKFQGNSPSIQKYVLQLPIKRKKIVCESYTDSDIIVRIKTQATAM